MYVFWVLFLVILNTIANQGDPNHGLTNVKTVPNPIPLYIVSMRNEHNSHICTGSILSKNFILTSRMCIRAKYFFYGLREYMDVRETATGINVTDVEPLTNKARLYKVNQEWNPVAILSIPPHSNSPLPQTGTVIGWYIDTWETKIEMAKIDNVNIEKAFSEWDEEFFAPFERIGTGSPLIHNNIIYGFVTNNPDGFDKFLPDVDEIRRISHMTS